MTTSASSCRRWLRLDCNGAETQRDRWNRSELEQRRRRRQQCRALPPQPGRLLARCLFAFVLLQATHFVAISQAKSIEIAPVNLATNDKSLAQNSGHKSKLDSPVEFLPSSITSISSKDTLTPSQTTSTTSETSSSSSGGKQNTSLQTSSTTTTSSNSEHDSTGAGDADYDAASGESVPDGEPAAPARPSDLARLVQVQDSFQAKVKEKIAGASRSSLELFEKLSLSGGCSSSLMNLMMGLSGIKSYAFKFIDASAKIPSGMMYGLLSDFGDFDQCLSIRSNPEVDPAHEAVEGSYSGKYCLLSIRLKYHIRPGPNGSAPEGIIPDGVFWDDLVKNYWTSNATKGFQVGVCVPSRCDNDDLQQIYRLLAETNNFEGELSNCQDGNDLRHQHTPDFLQAIILDVFMSLLALSLLATFLERYLHLLPKAHQSSLTVGLVTCFSIRRNWRLFLRQDNNQDECFPSRRVERHELMESRQAAVMNRRRPLLASQKQVQSFFSNTTELTKVEPAPSTDLSRSDSSESEQASSRSSQSGSSASLELQRVAMDIDRIAADCYQQLSVKVCDEEKDLGSDHLSLASSSTRRSRATSGRLEHSLGHLSGLKLLVIVWITVGHSFLYPSANNYQYYRSIIKLNITRDSVWFAATNFTLGIDTLLYLVGLIFVCKLADSATRQPQGFKKTPGSSPPASGQIGRDILSLLTRKILRSWPTYLSVIALTIVVPLVSDGPMWPEMVERRLGAACRQNWWANLLMVNNLMGAESICIPSSWFVSVMMQCLLLGSLVVFVERKWSSRAAVALIGALIAGSSLVSFAFAYQLNVRAPAIRMDESFVLEIDETIYRLYTSPFNNLAPFLVGMLGGLALVRWHQRRGTQERHPPSAGPATNRNRKSSTSLEMAAGWICQINLALAVGLVAVLVLSSVFHQHYTRFWASIYWSCHRLGWALVSGYLVHQCATGRWRLLRDLLSLSSFRPLSKLIFIAYLLFPIFIHLHSGLVRDGLHVSIYNMLNIYTTRLVMCFATALALHLFVELPFRSMEELLLKKCQLFSVQHNSQPAQLQSKLIESQAKAESSKQVAANRLPLLAVAQPATAECPSGTNQATKMEI